MRAFLTSNGGRLSGGFGGFGGGGFGGFGGGGFGGGTRSSSSFFRSTTSPCISPSSLSSSSESSSVDDSGFGSFTLFTVRTSPSTLFERVFVGGAPGGGLGALGGGGFGGGTSLDFLAPIDDFTTFAFFDVLTANGAPALAVAAAAAAGGGGGGTILAAFVASTVANTPSRVAAGAIGGGGGTVGIKNCRSDVFIVNGGGGGGRAPLELV
jgi:hypothetical protein|tara:strand:- start:4759 stop:5388 length:630 start_codon:yes stop_codon:yes gene_type:complete